MTGLDRNIDRNRHPRTPPHIGTISVSTHSVRPVLMYITARGHDSSAFLKGQGVDPLILRDPEARLPHAIAIRLWQAAGQLTNDLNLGLHVAEGIRPGAFGALDYAVRTSETMEMGLARLSRYHRFLHDVAEVKLTVHRDRAILSHRLPVPGGPPRAVSEFVLAGWLVTSRQATGVNWIPLEVRFPHCAPDDTSELHRLFGCTLKFGHDRSELVFSRNILDLPLLKADPNLQAILELLNPGRVMRRLPTESWRSLANNVART